MMDESRPGEYLALFPHVQLVRGAAGVAVHDLFRSRVFWFRGKAVAEALARMAMGERCDQAAGGAGISPLELDQYLAVFSELDLGTRVPQRTANHAFRPHLTRSQAREKGVFQTGGTVTVEFAADCVYQCPWCTSKNMLTAQACSCGVWPARGARISAETRISTIERLHEQGRSKLVVRGGEPLLYWDDLLLVLHASARLGMSVEIHSTGVLLTERQIEALKGIKVHFVLLLAAETEDGFDGAVGRRGSWNALMAAIQLLRRSRIAFTAQIPVLASENGSRAHLAEWAFGLGASRVEWLIYAPAGTKPAEFRAAVAPASPQAMAVGLDRFFANAQCQHCFANNCFIGADGSVTPCIGIREPLARLGEIDVTQVLQEDRLGPPQESTARRQIPECARCEFRFGCCSCLVRTTEWKGTQRARHWDCNYDPESAAWG